MTRPTLWILCLLGLALLMGCQKKPAALSAPPPPRTVSAAKPIVRTVVNYEDFTGQTDAKEAVDIRARVTGYLVKVAFKDGDIVQPGATLYQIDPRPYQNALDQAKGTLERLEAEKKLLQIQVDRYRHLAEKGAGSQQDLDEYVAKQAENVGAINAAKAQIAQAELNLDWTTVKAPIAGKLSRTLLTEGNLVNADTTLLTTLLSIDPMYGYFSIEEPTLLRIKGMIREGIIPVRDIHDVAVRMGLSDDDAKQFPHVGKLDFINNTVDPTTGTMRVRGVFANPYQMPDKPPVLAPGLFVRVRLPIGPEHDVLLVNERAIGIDQGQKFVYVLDEQNKVSYRRVTLGLCFDGLQSIEKGLEPGVRVVVDGLQFIRPGVAVAPDEVDMTTLQSRPKKAPAEGKPTANQARAGTP